MSDWLKPEMKWCMKGKLAGFLLALICNTVLAQEDVSLQEVIILALENNYDVRIQQNVVEGASTDLDYVYGAFVPRVNAVATETRTLNYQELEFVNENQNRKGDTRSSNLSASAQLAWTLFDGTRMFAVRSIAIETEQQAALQLKDQMVNTIASVINNYYDIVRQKQQLKAIQEQMAVSEERVKLSERKFQVGTGAKPELLQARVDNNALRTQALQQEALISQLKQQLNATLAMKLAPQYDVSDSIDIDMNIDQEEVVNEIDNRNYSILAAKAGLRIANDAIWRQRAEGFGTVDFVAAYNYNELENTLLLNPFGPTYSLNRGFNLGFTVNIPILNNFNNKRLVQQARIFKRRQELIYEQQTVNVNVALRNAFTDYDNARKILQVEEENIQLARENVTIALEVFRRGASTFVELRTAQQSLADAYTRLISARYLAKVAETELLRLNGSLLR
jgi:outer membrane protein